jgi:hypothetical protein
MEKYIGLGVNISQAMKKTRPQTMDNIFLIPYDKYQSRREKAIVSESNQTAKETGTTRRSEYSCFCAVGGGNISSSNIVSGHCFGRWSVC